jgi:hypothetical protein
MVLLDIVRVSIVGWNGLRRGQVRDVVAPAARAA